MQQKVTDQQTIDAWEEFHNQVKIAEKLGVTRQAVSLRIKKLKKQGVEFSIPICEVKGCESLAWEKMMCKKHYFKWRRTGHPLSEYRLVVPTEDWRKDARKPELL